jgi:hypothetical protein
VIVCFSVFISTSVIPLSKNANPDNVFAQDSNSSVIVENRAVSPEDLRCNDGNHPNTEGICADASHPLVIRANPIPTTEKYVNKTYSATTHIISFCADHSLVNSTTGKCLDGTLPLQISSEDLICINGSHPVNNGTCNDGSLPLLLNKTKTAVTEK